MDIKCIVEDGWPVLEGADVKATGYGYVIGEAFYPEWEVMVQFSGGQDGRAVWMVSLAECDGGLRVLQGRCPSGSLAATLCSALAEVTQQWERPMEVTCG